MASPFRVHWAWRWSLGLSIVSCLGAIIWLVEPRLAPCLHNEPMLFSLHPLWHVFAALGLNMWTCVCKFHRGTFYGFEVRAAVRP